MRLAAALLLVSGILCVSPALSEVTVQPSGQGFLIAKTFKQLPVHIGGRIVSGLVLLQGTDKMPVMRQVADDKRRPTSVNIYPHQWPGVYFEAAFEGADLYAKFNDSTNNYNLYIDNAPAIRIALPGNTEYRINGLSLGTHHVRLEKLSESQSKSGSFEGFFVDPDGKALPAPAAQSRQIEFIGDSYTVGYGNASSKRECTPDELRDTTDTQQAFGPLTAKHYGADYQVNAFSGRGIVRNYDGFIGDPLPALYPYALYDGKSEYNDPTWQPQIIMIALGGNDFSTPVHAGDKWKTLEDLRADYIASYVAFVKTLRARNPQASFLLADYGEPEVLANINVVIKRLKSDGETRIDLFNAGSSFELTGCDWHLNLADNKRISQTLITYLDAHPELWPELRQGK